jgi:hypothetical protein
MLDGNGSDMIISNSSTSTAVLIGPTDGITADAGAPLARIGYSANGAGSRLAFAVSMSLKHAAVSNSGGRDIGHA